MVDTSADGHPEEFDQLAGLAALDLLEGDELALFEEHAARCEHCQVTLRLDREVLAQVALAAPEMEPSPDFKQRLMARAAAELASISSLPARAPDADEIAPDEPAPERPAPIPIRPLTPNVRPTPVKVVAFWRRPQFLSALAAVLVVGLVVAGGFTYVNQSVVATVQLSGSPSGSASVIVRRSGAAELDMSGVPDPGQGFVYEAWVIPPNQRPIAAGTTPTGTAKLPLPGNVRGSSVAVTRERGPVTAPTSTPIMVGTVQS